MVQLEVGGQVELRSTNYVGVEEGSVIVLNCSFLADPQPTVTWLLNDVEINVVQGGRYGSEMRYENVAPIGSYVETLTILGLVEADQGNYTCLGQNEHINPQQPTNATQCLKLLGQKVQVMIGLILVVLFLLQCLPLLYLWKQTS